MNTYYGVSGFPKFRLYDREIGAAVTSTGRAIIDFTKNLMEEMGHKVVYGDSVSGDSKITLYDGKKQFLSHGNIENLFTHVDHVSEDGKEYCNLQGIYTDTIDEKGIARIKPVPYIMRHKTNKQMYRVQMTNQWYVDVTEDHSLFGYESKNQKLLPHERIVPVKPTELGSNIKSLIVKKSSHRNIERSMRYPKELYELMGYFIGCGSFNVKYGEKNYYIYLSGGNDVEEIITKILEPLKNSGHILNYWRKKKGDLCINGPIVQIFNEYIHSKEGKTIPKIIYDETVENIRAFVRGLFSSDGTCMMRNKSPIVRYCSIHKHLCEEIQSILHLIGIASSISRDNTENSYLGKYSGTWSHYVLIKSIREFATNVRFIEDRKNNNLDLIFDKFDKKHKIKELDIDITQIQSIEKIDHGEYVYDIEVEDTHRFFANNILVHNTDSVLCELGLEIKDLDDLIAKSKVIEKILNKSYDIFARDQLHVDKHFFSTKFEKVYRRFFQAGKKKRYAGHLVWKEGVVADKIDIVGFETKRSDTPKLSKKVLEKIIVLLLNGSDHATVKGYIKEVIRNYRKGVYPLEEIGIPSGITKDFKEYKNNDIRVRSAKYSNTYLHTDFKKGSKPKRIYVKQITGRKYPPTDVLSFEFADQVPPEFEVDYELMLNKTLRDPIIRMVESLGWTWESIDPSCSTLEMFGIQ
jgi:DNA polymerase I